MTDLMVHDITNPPLAANFFLYACSAGYEVVAENNATTNNMLFQIKIDAGSLPA